MIYNYLYSLDSLREKIALILNQHGASFETGTFTDSPNSIAITKSDIYTAIDKLIKQTVGIGVGTETFSLTLTDTVIASAVEMRIKDGIPKASGSSSPTSITILETDITAYAKAISSYKGANIKDDKGNPLLDEISLTDDESVVIQLFLNEGIRELEKQMDKILTSANLNTGTWTFLFTASKSLVSSYTNILPSYIKSYLGNYIVARWLDSINFTALSKVHYDKCTFYTNEFESLTLKKLESISQYASDAINSLNGRLSNLTPAYNYTSDTHTLGLTVAGNLSASQSTTLKGLITEYIYNRTAIMWGQKIGIQVPNMFDESVFQKYDLNKYDTYSASLSLRVSEIQQKLRFIANSVYTEITSVTFTFKDGGNFDAVSIQNITNHIKKFLINSVAYDWSVKINDNIAGAYNKEYMAALDELGKYSERKRDFIDQELKRACYRLYDNFAFIGKSLVRPVLFDESHAYPLQENITDYVTTFNIEEINIDAAGEIFYWFLMHGNWDDSQNYILDDMMEEALICYVAKEYFKTKPEFKQDFMVHSQRYNDLISEVRLILFSRKKNKATRMGTSWL